MCGYHRHEKIKNHPPHHPPTTTKLRKKMATLNVNIGALELKNPVMTASGTFGYGREVADLVPLDEIGGIIVKGTTL